MKKYIILYMILKLYPAWIKKSVKNRLVFMKTGLKPVFGKLPVESEFFLKIIYWFRYRFTGITDRFTGFGGFQLLPADGLLVLIPVIPIDKPVIPAGLPILDFLNSKFEFRAVFNRFYWFL
jgi:hypothetical protein